MTPPPERSLSLAAGNSAAAGTPLRHDTAALALIDRAKANGATWNTIGTALGMTGREAKRHAHKLRTRTRRGGRA